MDQSIITKGLAARDCSLFVVLWRGPCWSIVAFLLGYVIGSVLSGDERAAARWLALISAGIAYFWVILKDLRKITSIKYP